MTTKIYENMTVTVTCKENKDLEMMELIEKMNKTKAIRERTEEYYLPRIKTIGAAKWVEICNQLLGLCKTAESIGVKETINNFLTISFHRDDNGKLCRMWISYNPLGKVYILNCLEDGWLAQQRCLNPDEEYYSPSWGEDKDGWLVKWDNYNIYNLFRFALMEEIKCRIKTDETRIRSIQEIYDEIAGN